MASNKKAIRGRAVKTLTALTAVAGLIAFGWAGVASSHSISEKNEVSCNRTLDAPGILGDEYTVMWKEVDAVFYKVTLTCIDYDGNSAGHLVDVYDYDATNTKAIQIYDLQLLDRVKEGMVCQAWVRPFVDDHANDEQVHRSGHDVCDYPLTD